jgi:hypothetical protein
MADKKKPIKPRLKPEDYLVQIYYKVKKEHYRIAMETINKLIKQYK